MKSDLLVNSVAPDNRDAFSEREEGGVEPLGEADVVRCQAPTHQALVGQMLDIQNSWKEGGFEAAEHTFVALALKNGLMWKVRQGCFSGAKRKVPL